MVFNFYPDLSSGRVSRNWGMRTIFLYIVFAKTFSVHVIAISAVMTHYNASHDQSIIQNASSHINAIQKLKEKLFAISALWMVIVPRLKEFD